MTKTGGTGCETWLTLGPKIKLFCTNKHQNNTHTGTFGGQPCTARASLTTEHEAAYLWTAGVSIGVGPASITPGAFGANDQTSNATPQDWHDSGCDDTCSSSGGGVTNVRPPRPHGGPRAPEEESAMWFTCGTETGSPGSGAGDPPGDAGTNCYWDRWFIIYTDGSWDWLGGWERVCDGDEMRQPLTSPRASDPSALAANGGSGGGSRALRARVFGTGALASGLAAEVHRYRGDGFDALVYVDTSRVTVTDLGGALGAIDHLTTIRKHDHVAGIVRASTKRLHAAAGSAEILRSLTSAPERESHGRRARSVDVTLAGNTWWIIGH